MSTDIDDDTKLWKVVERWEPDCFDDLADDALWFLCDHVDFAKECLLLDKVFSTVEHASNVEQHLVGLLHS